MTTDTIRLSRSGARPRVLALANQATAAVDNALSSISPQLANLVQVELFKRSTDVSQDGGYVNALAGITGLLATITPPDVCALLNDVLTNLPAGLNSLPGVTLAGTRVFPGRVRVKYST